MATKEEKKPELMGQTEEEFITEASDRWTQGETFLSDTIEHGKKCLKAIKGDEEEQWDKNILATRKTDGRPYLIENMLPAFVRQVSGDFRLNTPATKVVMESLDADSEIAGVLQGKIYRIRYNSQADAIHQDAFEQALQSAFGAWGLSTRYKSSKSAEQEIYIRGFENPACLRWDPNCKLPDTSDKRWVQIYQPIPKKVAEKRWPNATWVKRDSAPQGANESLWWGEDFYGVREYLYVCEKEGGKYAPETEVYSCIISGQEILEGPTPLIWKRAIPIFLTFGEQFVIDGKKSWKTLVSDVLRIQQMHNYWITALTEAIALQPDAPYIGTKKQFAGLETIWNGTKKSRYLPYNPDPQDPGKPERQQPPTMPSALWQMPQYTKSAARDTIGIHEAGLGMKSNETSGIAIQRRQQESDTGTFVFTSNFRRALEFEGRCMVEGIQAIDYKAGKHIVMGIDAEQKTVEIGKPLDQGTYGTMVTIGPSMTTQRQEARETMTQLLQVSGSANPAGTAAVFPKVVKAMDMPDAHEIAEIYAATLPPEIQKRFYADSKDGDKPINIPPEMMAQLQGIQQKLAEADQIMQAQLQEIDSLKRGEAVKMADIEAKKEISAAEQQIEREKIMTESQLKEQEINMKYDLELKKIRQEAMLKMTAMHEEMTTKMHMHEVEQELKQANLNAERENAKKEEVEKKEAGE